MNIRYNQTLRRFEAEFSADFGGDLAAVKTAGFRTDGPPAWAWYTDKIKVLNSLREHRPESGLSINDDAWNVYESLTKMAEKNEEVKKAAKALEKERKKESENKAKEETAEEVFGEKTYITKDDLPPMPPSENRFTPPQPPKECCFVCGEPLYFYELPDVCIWCEKTA